MRQYKITVQEHNNNNNNGHSSMFCIFVVDQSSNGVPKISHTSDLGNPEVPQAYPPRAMQVVLAAILNSVGANGMQMVINYVGRKQ